MTSSKYDISYIDGALTISKATLAVTGNVVASRIYDGTTIISNAPLSQDSLSGVIGADGVSINTTAAAFADKNAGSGKTINWTYTHSGADTGNYQVAPFSTTNGTVTQVALTITPVAAQVRVVEQSDYVIAYTPSGWQGSDSSFLMSGALSFAGGDSAITLGNLSAGRNYALQLTPGGALKIVASDKPDNNIADLIDRAHDEELKNPDLI